jgi:uncharacterized protein YuzE
LIFISLSYYISYQKVIGSHLHGDTHHKTRLRVIIMKIEYDAAADALYIQLRTGQVAETVQSGKYVQTDLDGVGQPLDIEILFVKRHLALSDLTSITFNILEVVEPATPLIREEQAPYDADQA